MRVLVTGANGFVGKSICSLLERNSIEVIKLFSLKNNSLNLTNDELTFFADITDKTSLKIKSIKLKGLDAVVHAAGLAHQFGDTTKEEFWKVNVDGTKNIAELANEMEVKQFIQISSVSVYGDIQAKKLSSSIKEDLDCNPENFYAESKYASEKLCREIFRNTKTNLTILRLATVIGEGDIGNVFRLIETIDQRKFLWVGKGKNLKSLIYIEDLAQSIYKVLLSNNKKSGTYNLTAEAESMNRVVNTISKSLNKKVLPLRISYIMTKNILNAFNKVIKLPKLIQIEKSLEKWVANDNYSGDKFNETFKFKPKVSIEEALKREVNWYQNRK